MPITFSADDTKKSVEQYMKKGHLYRELLNISSPECTQTLTDKGKDEHLNGGLYSEKK